MAHLYCLPQTRQARSHFIVVVAGWRWGLGAARYLADEWMGGI